MLTLLAALAAPAASGAASAASAAPAVAAGVLLPAVAAAQEAPAVTLAGPFAHDAGHAFTAPVPADWPPDTTELQASGLVLLEDGRPLGPGHALHETIRTRGGGAYSHWQDRLVFSTGDNSDPNANGRTYTVQYRGQTGLGVAEYAPLALRDPFALLASAPAAAPAGPSERSGSAASPASAASAASATAAAPPPEPSPPTAPRVIWWYTIDALRADAVFALRGGERVMPALSAFAERDAVRFDRAYATASFTKTSTASMFTGLWPARHRVMHGVLPVWPAGAELTFDLDRRFVTLASLLAGAGYDTWTHLYTLHVRAGDGMLAGFAHLDLDVQGEQPLRGAPVPPRLFAYEHILGAHGPYAPSQAARARLLLPAAERIGTPTGSRRRSARSRPRSCGSPTSGRPRTPTRASRSASPGSRLRACGTTRCSSSPRITARPSWSTGSRSTAPRSTRRWWRCRSASASRAAIAGPRCTASASRSACASRTSTRRSRS
jgi:hypothetical protein